MKKISFIIPVYNCKEFLTDCIMSLRAAKVQDCEILLIDDGSTDGSGALCDELAETYPEIRVIHQENRGVSAARNRGLEEASGDYILFVDADDELLPLDDAVCRFLDQEADMLMFGMQFCYYHNHSLIKEEMAAITDRIEGAKVMVAERFETLFSHNYFSPVWNKLIKRSILQGNGILFDSRLTNYEDLAFSLYVLSKCDTIVALPDVYYRYHVNYDRDRTVDRVAKIDDLMGNTDLIAEAFAAFEKAAAVDEKQRKQIRNCLKNIYFELFLVKMKTTPLSGIGRYCRDFKADGYLNHCIDSEDLSSGQQRLYRWIRMENILVIWLFVRYLKLRHFAARNVKRILKWRLS